MAKKARDGRLKVALGPLRGPADRLAALMGMSLGALIRVSLQEYITRYYTANPGQNLTLRPGSMVFKPLSNGAYQPIAAARGGERVHFLSSLPNLPEALGRGRAWLVDVTSDDGGLEGRAVMVRLEDCSS
jgi:hypothetical protein